MFEEELSRLDENRERRRLTVAEPSDGPRVTVNGGSMLLMCSNDYLGLAGHPALKQAASAAMERYGFGSGASRLISGTGPLHRQLEERLSRFKGTEAALLFNSGYAANTGIIPALAGTGDVILSDSLNHASIIDGCRLSKGKTLVYRHKDLDHVEELLRKETGARRRLIVTDGVFSMDGDMAPLPDLAFLAERYGGLLMVDDAHGTGVLGSSGRGIVEHFNLGGRVPVQMGTFGKALGSFGAYAAGDRTLIDYLVNRARSFMFSTALPAAVCAASIAALDIVEKQPQLRERLWKNRGLLVNGLASAGIAFGNSETPIVPVITGDAAATLKAADRLAGYGIFAAAIRPPTVAEGSSRLRVTVTAAHSEQDIGTALDAFGHLKREGYFQHAAGE